MTVDKFGTIISSVSDNTWNYYINNIKYFDSFGITITHNNNTGIVLKGIVNLIPTYRFITNNTDVNGYPLEDSFYSEFILNVLSGLLATR